MRGEAPGLVQPDGGVQHPGRRAEKDRIDDRKDAAGQLPNDEQRNDRARAQNLLFVPEVEAGQRMAARDFIDWNFRLGFAHVVCRCSTGDQGSFGWPPSLPSALRDSRSTNSTVMGSL